MNLILKLLFNFFINEKLNTFFILISGILVSLVETYGVSKNIAQIISTAQSGNIKEMEKLIKVFCFLSTLYVGFNYIYERCKNTVLIKLRQWFRVELIRILMKSNNENFTDKNFIKLNSPINRISNVAHLLMSEFFTYLIPSVLFITVVFCFFTYNDPFMGAVFIISNLFLMLYVFLVMPTIVKKNKEYEDDVNENESHVLEILNNMDKIVYRGQTTHEAKYFDNLTKNTINKSNDFYYYVNLQESILTLMMYVIIVAFLIYNIKKVKNKEISKVLFITFITVIMLYKDKINVVIWQISNFVEFTGRVNGVLEHYNEAILLKEIDEKSSDIEKQKHVEHKEYLFGENKYKPVDLEFNKIEFKNVSFKYRTKDVYVLKNFNMDLYLNDKIIGFTGVSGRGKTTLMKLVLKMYRDYDGDILIDGVNIRDIDPDYLRKNIIYVNQNSKLFDRLIVENIMYGCDETEHCNANLKKIMSNYPKIRELFKDNDIYSTRVGPLGEKMSGGQRMIISILTALVSTEGCGLVLDEPTTGLDPELKREIIDLIRDNKESKKFIIIVSHDKDIYRIFDEKKVI